MLGCTETERLKHLIEKNPEWQNIGEEISFSGVGKPEEFASAFTFLASQRACYITGVNIAVDSNWLKWIDP